MLNNFLINFFYYHFTAHMKVLQRYLQFLVTETFVETFETVQVD